MKSVNELVAQSHSALDLINHSSQPSKSLNISDYFANNLKIEIDNLKNYANRKTGFDNIDHFQFFSPGLYVIGALLPPEKPLFAGNSLTLNNSHKTVNLAFFAPMRCPLLNFSQKLPQEIFFFTTSNLLSLPPIFVAGLGLILSILSLQKSQTLISIFKLSNFKTNPLTTCSTVFALSAFKRKKLLSFAFYLQIIPHHKDNIKLGIDDTVRKLKKFQRNTNTTFIVISSFNRTNYNQSVSFESFKESGGIEYSADVVWALQLFIMNEIKGGAIFPRLEKKSTLDAIIPTLKIPTNFEMFQTYIKFLKNIFGFIVDGVILQKTFKIFLSRLQL